MEHGQIEVHWSSFIKKNYKCKLLQKILLLQKKQLQRSCRYTYPSSNYQLHDLYIDMWTICNKLTYNAKMEIILANSLTAIVTFLASQGLLNFHQYSSGSHTCNTHRKETLYHQQTLRLGCSITNLQLLASSKPKTWSTDQIISPSKMTCIHYQIIKEKVHV
jgi:hypothetical protein